jgi:hypothetical protein
MVPANSDARDRRHNSGGTTSATLDALLADSDLSPDLVCLVERVCQNELPWVVVSGAALIAWQQRDPAGWKKVSERLAANGITVVRI